MIWPLTDTAFKTLGAESSTCWFLNTSVPIYGWMALSLHLYLQQHLTHYSRIAMRELTWCLFSLYQALLASIINKKEFSVMGLLFCRYVYYTIDWRMFIVSDHNFNRRETFIAVLHLHIHTHYYDNFYSCRE